LGKFNPSASNSNHYQFTGKNATVYQAGVVFTKPILANFAWYSLDLEWIRGRVNDTSNLSVEITVRI
jgi:hypothetical protein